MSLLAARRGTIAHRRRAGAATSTSTRPTITFPAAANVRNVVTNGADPTGVADSTTVIQNTIRDCTAGSRRGQTIYFPEGTYKLSAQLVHKNSAGHWLAHIAYQGEHRDRTVLKLVDGAAGFGNAGSPRALVYTASKDPGNQTQIDTGSGNKGFHNSLLDLTIDTGNNTGAVGVDYICHNIGAMRRVLVKGNGWCGVLMERPWPGPCLLHDVEVDGFSYGIRIDQLQYNVVLDQIVLKNQTVESLRHNRCITGIRNLSATGAVTNPHADGVIALLDSPGVTVTNNSGVVITDPAAYTIPVPAFPDVPWYPNTDDWANVDDYGSQQAALNSGKPVILYPAQTGATIDTRSVVGTTLTIPDTVKRIIFMYGAPEPESMAAGQAMFETDSNGTTTDPLVFERGWFSQGTNSHKDWYFFQHRNGRPLHVVDCQFTFGGGNSPNAPSFRQVPGAGPVFVDSSNLSLRVHEQAYGRQFNIEGSRPTGGVFVRNAGRFWTLGLKSEKGQTCVDTAEGGRSEVLAGAFYPAPGGADQPMDTTVPAVKTVDSDHEVQFATIAYSSSSNDYTIMVQETVAGTTTNLNRSAITKRHGAQGSYVRDSG